MARSMVIRLKPPRADVTSWSRRPDRRRCSFKVESRARMPPVAWAAFTANTEPKVSPSSAVTADSAWREATRLRPTRARSSRVSPTTMINGTPTARAISGSAASMIIIEPITRTTFAATFITVSRNASRSSTSSRTRLTASPGDAAGGPASRPPLCNWARSRLSRSRPRSC